MARCLIGTVLLMVIGLVLAGCDDQGAASPDGREATPGKAFMRIHPRVTAMAPTDAEFVTIVTADRAATLDPHNTESGGDVKVINQIYQTLLRIDPDDVDRLMPELAESWTVADDGLAITFAMRRGVKFHDGAELDALAAKRSLDRLRGTYLDVPAAPYRGVFDFITDVHADGMTLTVQLNRPVARVALRNLSMFPASIISPRLLEATMAMDSGRRSTFISEWASGTGPYFLSKFDSAEGRVRLGAFDGHWGSPPAIGKLLFRHVPDPNSQIEYLKSGEADMLDDVPRPVWKQLERDPKVTMYRWWALNVCYLALNTRHDKTRDINVRKAIRLAIDRQPLKDLYYGSARET